MELKNNNFFRSVYFPNNGMETFHKITKQWNGIFVPFHSIPLRSVMFHQSKQSLIVFLGLPLPVVSLIVDYW